jgi:hypothetical protein
MEHNKWKCGNWRCGWVGTKEQILVAPDPFNEGCELVACPDCRDVGNITAACYMDGCTKDGGCGTPTADGYKWSCVDHIPNEES